ncbi:hypothetical protein GCM10008171_15770 [Methylopila jiangsuensis]|uniref:Flagellar assembly protein FliH n=1 Tax=Methylopila jiangsuensis TaxID=586230 RepID=A0A9W6JHH2_9HYPH|nr:FliH/SctL family protein [Methylopila jiangsuensis]MDR6284160.1 flagellar assembly protein FliH [Methylopila jiangsuensis]GLK76323.1 hypothetical protein GCM10008171_15770 [Methylopila jiangsuensis]
MTSKPAPFLFDRDFAAPAPKAPPPAVVALAEHEAALTQAEASGFRRGEAEGRRAMRDSDAARLVAAVETLGARLAASLDDADRRAREQERAGVDLALALARKLAGAAMARAPLAEIAAAAEACFAELRQAPHVAVRVAPALVESVKAELTAIAQTRGFAGRLIVLGDPDVAVGDARLEWADGGVVRDAAAVAAALETVIARHFAAEEGGPEGDAT